MSQTPEIPFLLTRWTRFAPLFQTDNADASLGADGLSEGSWFIIGRTLIMDILWVASGAGISPGTGTLKVPFPPGYTVDDVDIARMPRSESGEGVVQGMVIAPCYSILNGAKGAQPALIAIETVDGVVEGNELQIEDIATLADAADSIVLRIELPLKEPALPG